MTNSPSSDDYSILSESLDTSILATTPDIFRQNLIMATSDDKLPNFAKFKLNSDGKNYSIWLSVIELLLSNETDCWEITNSEIESTDARYAAANTKARNIIFNSLDFTLFQRLFATKIAKTTAALAYTTIKTEFDNTSGTCQQAVMQKLFSFRFNPNKTPTENVNAFRSIVQSITSSGGKVDDSVLCSRLIEAIPASWSSFKQYWCLQASSDRTLSNLYTLIENEEIRLRSESKSQPKLPAPVAFISQFPFNNNQP